MSEPPELSREFFEILAVRELRKAGLEVGSLRVHRQAMLPEPERGYLLEFAAIVTRGTWRSKALIACRHQDGPIGGPAIEAFTHHLEEAGALAGILFGAPDFEPEALRTAASTGIALLRVTDGRTAFDTSGWGTPGHYPAWLPAYCAQLLGRDPVGQPRYELLESRLGDVIVAQLQRKGTEHGGGAGAGAGAGAEGRDGRAPGVGR
ncbi:MAG TPA: restriction endonuclease [Gemmatimonadales bacterium]|nr:restriction endonuclease [Gemmatimonadales bacterium]